MANIKYELDFPDSVGDTTGIFCRVWVRNKFYPDVAPEQQVLVDKHEDGTFSTVVAGTGGPAYIWDFVYANKPKVGEQ